MLVRRIFCTTEWTRLSDSSPEDANPSCELTKEFLDNKLSVYRVNNQDELPKLAAALCMLHSTGLTRCMLAAIDDQVPEKKGWKVHNSPGATEIKTFDESHCDIIIENLATLTGVLRSFLDGNVFEYSQKDVSQAITQLFLEGSYDVVQIAASAKDVKPPPVRGLLKAIASSLISVHAA